MLHVFLGRVSDLRTFSLRFFSDFLEATLSSPENPLFSPCIHTAGESKNSSDYQERRSAKSPPRSPVAAARSGAAVPCRLQSHSAGAQHTPPLSWKNVLSSVPGTGSASFHPTAPELRPHTRAGKSGAAPVSHLPDPISGSPAPPGQQEGHTAHFRPLSSFPSTLRLCLVCQGHVRFTSPSRAPISPGCPSAVTVTKGSLQSLPEIKQVTLRSTRDASPPTSSSRGRDDSPGPRQRPGLLWGASWEWREAPATAAGCRPVPSHFKGCPAGSKRASPGAQVRAGCARQHIASVTRILEEPE